MSTLKIFIKGVFFKQISRGEKYEECRKIKPFWTSRLYDKEGKRIPYEFIEFINGMKPDAPRMTTEYLGLSKRKDEYVIKVGKVLKRKNFKK